VECSTKYPLLSEFMKCFPPCTCLNYIGRVHGELVDFEVSQSIGTFPCTSTIPRWHVNSNGYKKAYCHRLGEPHTFTPNNTWVPNLKYIPTISQNSKFQNLINFPCIRNTSNTLLQVAIDEGLSKMNISFSEHRQALDKSRTYLNDTF